MFLFRPLAPELIWALFWDSSFPVINNIFGQWDTLGLELTDPMVILFAGVRFRQVM